MSELWLATEGIPLSAPSEAKTVEPVRLIDQPLKRMVDRILKRELSNCRDRSPHAQLGVPVNASKAAIRAAYERQCARFDPRTFSGYGAAQVALAEEISGLLRAAYAQLCPPPQPVHPATALAPATVNTPKAADQR